MIYNHLSTYILKSIKRNVTIFQQNPRSSLSTTGTKQESFEDTDVPPEQSGSEKSHQQNVSHERWRVLRPYFVEGKTSLFDLYYYIVFFLL